jgi:hypothetical protein
MAAGLDRFRSLSTSTAENPMPEDLGICQQEFPSLSWYGEFDSYRGISNSQKITLLVAVWKRVKQSTTLWTAAFRFGTHSSWVTIAEGTDLATTLARLKFQIGEAIAAVNQNILGVRS